MTATRTGGDLDGVEPAPALDSRADELHRILGEVRRRTVELTGMAARTVEVSRELRSTRSGARQHAAELDHLREVLKHVQAELDGLRVAMRTRGIIEQAKGMLMVTRGIDAEQAWSVLVELSQTTHRKLVDVAAAMVEAWRVPHDGPS